VAGRFESAVISVSTIGWATETDAITLAAATTDPAKAAVTNFGSRYSKKVIESHFAGSLGPDMDRLDCCDKLDNVEWLVHCIEQ
jgi:hypothetical protein